MSDDVPDLAALRGARQASDAECIEELEQLSLGQEREVRRLWAIVEELTSFANHAENCAVEADPLGVQNCDCGLDLVLAQLDASEKRTSSDEALTLVGDAASAFIGARDRWHAEAARRGTMPDVEFQRAYDDALDALLHAVRQLDAGGEGT